ncbi:hypothetical protein C8F04DRAFT_1194563 [Mycena alexandri]|uniref:Uncharacterized protein n=1 Tax=Mycena alexandri TaxID=1745969 RepID=A0AAD6S6Z6_9AGAR|nr:hypothetical protein C8F04DRAFT_1194563 [Mycena alexandri]
MSDTSTGPTDFGFGSKKKPTLAKKARTSGTSIRESSSRNRLQTRQRRQRPATRLALRLLPIPLCSRVFLLSAHEVDVSAVTVNLNLYVAYTDGELHWVSRGAGGFRSTSAEKSIRLEEGAVLVASCREGSSGSYQDVQLDLNDYFTFNSGTNVFEPIELEFTLEGAEEIVESSRSLMDITLISSFNLSKLLNEPVLHKAITDVAERAESDAQDQRSAVMSQMNEEVEAINEEMKELKEKLEKVANRSRKATEEVNEKLETISKESSQRFEREMTTLINAVAKMAMKAVYAQIRELELKVLSVKQQEVYEAHWPPPPYKAAAATGSGD